MKKIEQYLLERYPTIWNTRLAKVLSLAFVAHLLFFLLGYLLLTDKSMDYYFSLGENYNNFVILLNLIISTLLLVGWFIYLFRNNAFQHFYPMKNKQLFGQFVLYFIIIFSCISFYIPFIAGEKAKIHWRYTDSYINEVLRHYPENFDTDKYRNKLSEEERQNYYIATNAHRVKQDSIVKQKGEEITALVAIAFIASTLLFTLRISSLRTVLFSIVFAGIVTLLLIFLILLAFSIDQASEYTVLLFLWIAYLSILFLSIKKHKKKFNKGILINTALLFFLPVLLVTYNIIEVSKSALYRNELATVTNTNIFESEFYKIKWFIIWGIAITFSFVFVALYTRVVRQWKALPE